MLDLTGMTSVTSFSDVLAHMTQVGSSAVIDLRAGDTITLSGVHTTELHADDFVF